MAIIPQHTGIIESRLSILNVVPIFDLGVESQPNIVLDKVRIETALSGFVEAVKSQGHSCAWVLRDDFDLRIFSDGRNPNYFFPGTALIIAEVDSEGKIIQ